MLGNNDAGDGGGDAELKKAKTNVWRGGVSCGREWGTVDWERSPFFKAWCNNFESVCRRMRLTNMEENELENHTVIGISALHGKKLLVPSNEGGRRPVAFDPQVPDRVFVGEVVTIGYASSNLIGVIVYFDKGGKVCKVTGLPQVIAYFDDRNGYPFSLSYDSSPLPVGKETLYLAGRFVGFRFSERDGYGDSLQGLLLGETDFVEPCNFEMKTESSRTCDWPLCYGNRWVRLGTSFVDLLSIRSESKKPIVDMVDVLAETALDDLPMILDSYALPVSSYLPKERNGYPCYCIKCGRATYTGAYTFRDSADGGTTHCGLGHAACSECWIRYSRSDKRWECFQVSLRRDFERYICGHTVDSPHFVCSQPHQGDVTKLEPHMLPKDALVFSVKLTVAQPEGRGQASFDLSINAIQAKKAWETKLRHTPFGVWKPAIHNQFPYFVREAVFTWLLIAKRFSLPKDLRCLIVEYLCTKNNSSYMFDQWGSFNFSWLRDPPRPY